MSLAYFPLYPDDFEADTAHLSLAEDGAFNRLLRLCWRTPGCSVPADRTWVYRRLRAYTEADQAIIETILTEFFREVDGRLSNARLTKEWLAANEAHTRRKSAGAKGGKAKALKTNETGPSNATPMLKQPEPEPEPIDTTAKAVVPQTQQDIPESKSTGKVRGAARRSKLPKDWTPNIANLAYASKNGLSREEINHEADQFRNHAAAQGRLAANWDAAFRTWLGNTVKWRAERAASSAARTKPGGQSRGGGIFAAGVRAVSEARGYGQPVRDEDERRRGNDDMGAGHDIDGEFFRITGT